MKLNFAKRMSYIKASEIREILKVTEQEDVISFAGGLPAPELFPIDEINEINQIVLKEAGTKALQYTTTEGYAPLREWIANRMNERLGTAFDKDNILITHGSQQGLDLSGKVFLDEGDIVLCESPTYLFSCLFCIRQRYKNDVCICCCLIANNSFGHFLIIACLSGFTSSATITSLHYSVPQE